MDQKAVKLVLPWPPSVNQIWATTRRGNWYSTKIANDFKEHVAWLVRNAKASAFDPKDDLGVTLYAYPPDNRRRDLDNLIKVVCDALQEAMLFQNDCQIKRILMEMLEKREKGSVVITVERLERKLRQCAESSII